MREFSCHGCKNRTATCHATCEIFKKEQEQHQKDLKKKRTQVTLDNLAYSRVTRRNTYFLRKYGKAN